jgi:subtilisin family serine protease
MVEPWLAGCTGRGVRVGVVDSGISASHPHVAGIAGGVEIGADGALGSDVTDRIGHGTAVAAAIREKAPGVELFAIKVFDRSLATRATHLQRALSWAAGSGIRLVNLSLGTRNRDQAAALADAVAAAVCSGTLVVAARDDEGGEWYPGALPGVVPVVLDWTCPRDRYRVQSSATGPVFAASGYPRPVPGLSPERNLRGISFAVANMTGFAARALEATPEPDLDGLLHSLAAAALEP